MKYIFYKRVFSTNEKIVIGEYPTLKALNRAINDYLRNKPHIYVKWNLPIKNDDFKRMPVFTLGSTCVVNLAIEKRNCKR